MYARAYKTLVGIYKSSPFATLAPFLKIVFLLIAATELLPLRSCHHVPSAHD
jgi:hypothetical protein